MAQSRCIGLYGPFTNLPFWGCAMYFDYKVRDTFNEWYIEPAFFLNYPKVWKDLREITWDLANRQTKQWVTPHELINQVARSSAYSWHHWRHFANLPAAAVALPNGSPPTQRSPGRFDWKFTNLPFGSEAFWTSNIGLLNLMHFMISKQD